ncbi:hypothetical protein ACFVYT_23100 [Streptomyces sp. NPDC058290]|uniref:hypothetical protein n=1 Tax=Streptomyces sp. NPDC058290 TaxID=3346426 RepID=UPI0036E0A092
MPNESLSADDRLAVLAERQAELAGWPRLPSWKIEALPLLHIDKPQFGVTIPSGDDMQLRQAVEALGRCFQREMRFDFPPFTAKPSPHHVAESVEGLLFNSKKLFATFPVATGAAGMSVQEGEPWLDWIWIHPFERGRGLVDAAWSDLERTYGSEFRIQQPISRAMKGFLRRREVDPKRWTTENSGS